MTWEYSVQNILIFGVRCFRLQLMRGYYRCIYVCSVCTVSLTLFVNRQLVRKRWGVSIAHKQLK